MLVIGLVMMNDKKEVNSSNKKVLIIGFDGMDYGITKQMMAEGKLPNFKRLADDGSFVKLDTSYPPQTPVAWTVIASGVNPGGTGIFDFIRRDLKSKSAQGSGYIPELGLATFDGSGYQTLVKSIPFWKVTSDAGIPTTIIRWPLTFPPESLNGNMISGLGVPDVRGLLSGYTFYGSEDMEEDSKNIQVSRNGNKIETFIRGPNINSNGKMSGVNVPMNILIDDNLKSAEFDVGGKKYNVSEGNWSDWISTDFRLGIFKKTSAIYRIYLVNLDPFKMYVTSMNVAPQNPLFGISYPTNYASSLADQIGNYYTLGQPEETEGYVDGKIDEKAMIEQVNQIQEEREKMFWNGFANLKKEKSGIYSILFDSSDRMQHVFWNNSVFNNKDGKIGVSKEVEQFWIESDNFMGKVLDNLDSNTTLLVMSDHGFTSYEESVTVNTFLVNNAFMQQDNGLANENALFQGVKWDNTKAYSLGFNSIYINLKSREKNGIVDPSDKSKVEDEIISKLENLKDSSGRKAVYKVYKTEEVYSGSSMADAPDLIVGFNPGFRMSSENAVGGFTKEVITVNDKKWNGDHMVDPKFVPGVLFSNVKLNKDEASQLDIAPTIYAQFGISKGNLTGESLI
ncbi:MAG: alkaline phosphatase family protein [archaeon]